VIAATRGAATELPDPSEVVAVKLVEVPHYCEGVVFDHAGRGYVSEGDTIVQFTLDGKQQNWAVTGAPNGHKVLADGTHLVCDGSRHAVLRLSADGKLLAPVATQCDGKSLREPNDLSLDTRNGGFYFTDPGGSEKEPVGTVHYADASGKTYQIDQGLLYPNGIVLTPDGKRLYLAESIRNRVHVYDVVGPGKVANRRVFADLPSKNEAIGQIDNQPDGMCLDAAGNLYVTHYGMKQVQVLSPEGEMLARYDGGNLMTSNAAFGGPKMDQLFVTGSLTGGNSPGGVFRLDLGVKGLKILPESK
jgi:gluconolactonase